MNKQRAIIPYGPAVGDFYIHNPEVVKWKERNEFIRKVCSTMAMRPAQPAEPPADKPSLVSRAVLKHLGIPKEKLEDLKFLQQLGYYGGRVLEQRAVEAGHYVEPSNSIVFSCELLDILRCAATPHFYSCFVNPARDYGDLPKIVAEEQAGIGIAYVNDGNGFMRGRCWFHHAKCIDSGEDMLVVCSKQGGTLDAVQIARTLKVAGFRAAVDYTLAVRTPNRDVEYVDCFDKDIHWDLPTWTIRGRQVVEL